MANPTWFVAKDYLAAKLAQLTATDPKGNWTAESLTKVLEANGYKGDEGAYKHFNDFGMNENVSPNALFNAKEYLAAKAAQLTALKVDGKEWNEVSVMDAIKAAGMNSAWEHYDKFGSNEGINPSNGFNAEGYITAKTKLMNETSEGGRTNWTIAEVKAAFAENGLNALEHYNLFGQDEFKAAGKTADLTTAITVTDKVIANNTFDPYTGAETYADLISALAAQKAGSLAAKYTITAATDAGDVTVAQQAGLAALLAGATPAITTTATYHLVDTVSALADVSTTILTGSTKGSAAGYDISDTLANVAAGADGLVNGATVATAKVAFGAKAADDKVEGSKADVATTTVKYDDIDGKVSDGTAQIALAKADPDAKGKAEIVIDASATATGLGTTEAPFDVDAKALAAFTSDSVTALGATFNFIGTAKADTLTVGTKFASINAGAGDDIVSVSATSTGLLDGGAGTDTLQVTGTTAVTFTAGQIKGFEALDLSATDVQAVTMASADYAQFATIKTADADTITFSDAAANVTLHAGSAANLSYTLFATEANTVKVTGDNAVAIIGGGKADTINGSAAKGALTITGGAGADQITLGAGADTVVVSKAGDSTVSAYDQITGFAAVADDKADTLDMTTSTAALMAKTGMTDWTISDKGIATKASATVADFLKAATENTTAGAVAFDDGTNTYVVYSDGKEAATDDVVVELLGVHDAVLGTTAAADTILIA